ncbi:mCG1051116 [Mus musculus]|nr:mCG1051116 [Mus musculus]
MSLKHLNLQRQVKKFFSRNFLHRFILSSGYVCEAGRVDIPYVHAGAYREAGEGVGSSGTRVTGGCKPLCRHWKLSLGLLQGQ